MPFKQNFYYQFVARSKYCFSLQFPHFSRLKKTHSLRIVPLDSHGSHWQRRGRWRRDSSRIRVQDSQNAIRGSVTPLLFFFLSLLYERPHPLSESTFTAEITDPGRVQGRLRRLLLLTTTFAATRKGHKRRSSLVVVVVVGWFFLSQPERLGSRFSHGRRHSYGIKSVARLCLHRERTSPLSLPLPSFSSSSPFLIPMWLYADPSSPPLPFFFSLSTLSLLIIEILRNDEGCCEGIVFRN